MVKIWRFENINSGPLLKLTRMTLCILQSNSIKHNLLYQWNLFPLTNGKLAPVHNKSLLKCFGSLTFSLVSITSTNVVSTMQGTRFSIAHNHTCSELSMSELLYMLCFFVKQTGNGIYSGTYPEEFKRWTGM